MQKLAHFFSMAVLACGLGAPAAAGQGASGAKTADPNSSVRQAMTGAERGRCPEALPVLQRDLVRVTDKQLRYRAAIAAARCLISVGDSIGVANVFAFLRREFPDDPEFLYLSARYYSQLANLTAQELAARFPNSAQVAKMNAESLEAQRKWDDALQAYRKILADHPDEPDIHFRIARILLDKSAGGESAEAKKELEQELKINPDNAGAEFVLGEIARRAGNWSTAAEHFTKAKQLDAGFMEAYLALGMSYAAAGNFADAIPPLEIYTKKVSADPAGHYQLAMAYARTGNKAAADRQLELHKAALAKSSTRRPSDMPPQ